MLVVLVFAWATYALIRVLQRRGITPPPKGGAPRPRTRPGTPPRTVAPDDDEDFLRELDRRRLHPDDPDQPST